MSENKFIYFDNAASTRPLREAVELFSKISYELYGNPNSLHSMGTKADEMLEKSRKQILSILCHNPEKWDCVFTSGATEGNNIAILGGALAKESYTKRILMTTAEHQSVSKVYEKLEEMGFEVVRIKVSKNGDIDFQAYEDALKKGVGLISAIYCCNQTGALLPIKEMSEMAKRLCPRAYFHTDATQAVNKINLHLDNVDIVTFSGHKIGALRGSGALLKKKSVNLIPPEVGGGQEQGLRSGTQNTPGCASIAVALRIGKETLAKRTEDAYKLNEYIKSNLKSFDGIELLSPNDGGLPFVLAYGLKNIRASVMDEFLSMHGIYVSTTSACDDRMKEPNDILRSMGFETHVADNPIRLSFTGEESLEDAEEFIKWFKEGLRTLRPDKE